MPSADFHPAVPPLRVLVMVSGPVDAPALDTEGAWQALAGALASCARAGLVQVERLPEPTEGALRTRLTAEPYHVLHFVGHARSRPGAQYTTLLLEGAGRRARSVNVQYLGALLQPHPSLRLVVLQACADSEPFAGAARTLVEGGLAAAVAIRRPLTRPVTTALVHALYQGLAAGASMAEILAGVQQPSSAEDVATSVEIALHSDFASGRLFPVGPAVAGPVLAVPPPPSAVAAPSPAELAAEAEVTRGRLELERKRAAGAFDVFLCHNGADKPAVKTIAHRLQDRGILPWLDEWELPPGQPWQPLLEQHIASIRSAAVFVGGAGVGPWQEQELNAFLREFVARKSPVIPVLLPNAAATPTLPVFLRAMTWVDFRVADPDPFERLIWGITGQRPEG
ncbi:MAG: TIR domain-containing protein [Candidatus Rokuibacteriota bacterium]